MKKLYSLVAILAISLSANAQIVINEVYGGGGNSGASYKHDFVELKNIGTTAATLSGATLQYASASGTFNQYHEIPTITLQPNETYVIREGAGNGSQADTPADFIAPTPTNFGSGTNNTPGFNMAGTNLKIALASNNSQVTGPTDANVLDFVGTGSANQFEGSAAAPVMSNTTSAQRVSGDTNQNNIDFIVDAPTPTPLLAVSDINVAKRGILKNTLVNDEIIFDASSEVQIFNINGQVVKSAKVSEGTSLNVSSLSPGIYVVKGEVDGQLVNQKIIKK